LEKRNIKDSLFFKTFKKLVRRRTALIGLIIVMVNLIFAGLGLFYTPYPPNAINARELYQSPSVKHWLGTDHLGRDQLSRMMAGASISIAVGVVSVSIALLVGSTLGLICGYFRGKVDLGIMAVMEALWAFPSLILALVITSVLGPGIRNIMVSLGIVSIPGFCRMARGMTMSIRENEYVESAIAIGLSKPEIIFKYILPNVASVIIVQASLNAANAILSEASLSFLGLGIVPPAASWGSMVRVGADYLLEAPWLSIVPGAGIFLLVMGLNFLGDGLRDALDVRIKAD